MNTAAASDVLVTRLMVLSRCHTAAVDSAGVVWLPVGSPCARTCVWIFFHVRSTDCVARCGLFFPSACALSCGLRALSESDFFFWDGGGSGSNPRASRRRAAPGWRAAISTRRSLLAPDIAHIREFCLGTPRRVSTGCSKRGQCAVFLCMSSALALWPRKAAWLGILFFVLSSTACSLPTWHCNDASESAFAWKRSQAKKNAAAQQKNIISDDKKMNADDIQHQQQQHQQQQHYQAAALQVKFEDGGGGGGCSDGRAQPAITSCAVVVAPSADQQSHLPQIAYATHPTGMTTYQMPP